MRTPAAQKSFLPIFIIQKWLRACVRLVYDPCDAFHDGFMNLLITSQLDYPVSHHIPSVFQVSCPGGDVAEAEAAAQQATPIPAPRPREHHHRPRRHTRGRHKAC